MDFRILYTQYNKRLVKILWNFLDKNGLVAQSCLTVCNPMDCSPPGSSVHGILQTRILEWVAIPFSRGCSWLRSRTLFSCIVGRFFTIWALGKPWIRIIRYTNYPSTVLGPGNKNLKVFWEDKSRSGAMASASRHQEFWKHFIYYLITTMNVLFLLSHLTR